MKTVALLIVLFLSSLAVAQDGSDELMAAQYFRQGDYEKAAALYETLVKTNPSPVVYQNYLECLFQLEDFGKAEAFVNDKIRLNPESISLGVDFGWVLDRSGKSREAQSQFERLIRALDADHEQVTALASAFVERSYFDLALETYMRGRSLLADKHLLHIDIAGIHERTGNFVAMMNEYIDYLEINKASEERVRGMLQDAIANDLRYEKNEALRNVLLGRTQRSPSNTMYSKMLLWLSIQQKDFRVAFNQARALDRRLRQHGELVLDIAQLATSNQEYIVAALAYQYLLDKGPNSTYFLESTSGFLNVRFKQITSSYNYSKEELLEVEKEYENTLEELGINHQTVTLVRNLANLKAFYLGNSEGAIDLLNQTINLPGVNQRVRAQCRVELADILLLSGNVWDATLLYSQVDKAFRDDPLAHEAKFKNARLSFYIGEFDWAKAQLDILKAGTSRLIANDAIKLSLRIQDNVGFDDDTRPLKMYAKAEMLTFMNRFDEAVQVLDSTAILYSSHQIADDVILARAQIMLARGRYQEADSLLAIIVEKFPNGLLADDALFKRAELHQKVFQKPEDARSLYQQLLVAYPGSLNAATARNRFRELREPL